MPKLLLVVSIALLVHGCWVPASVPMIYVDDGNQNGDGTASNPFNSIPAAVAYAHTLTRHPNIIVRFSGVRNKFGGLLKYSLET